MAKTIKEIKNILLTDIDVPFESMSRKSFVELLRKWKPENWHKILKISGRNEGKQLKELMDSMKSAGQLECIGVKKIDVSEELLKEDGREGVYILMFGLRRFVAAYLLGWKRIKSAIF